MTAPSLWDRTAEESAGADQPLARSEVDLAVIGAGYTGLSTALHAAGAGLSVQVIEAHAPGFGGSGRNVGLVNAGVWHPPDRVRDALGADLGPRFVSAMGAAPARVFDLIERHQIRCDARRHGTIHAAHAAAGMTDLRARHAAWQAMGAPVRLLDAEAVAEATGATGFHGGLLDARAGTLNPMGYCRGLARAARAAGAAIRSGLPVTGLTRDAARWRLETAEGAVSARAVVLAVNAYADRLWPGLEKSFVTLHYFQIATEPLGDRVAGILRQPRGLWDTGRVMISLRRDEEDRLVIGSMGRLGSEKRARAWAARRLGQLFPGLGPLRFESAWHGRIAMTPDHLPRIAMPAPGLYVPTGYNGRGITTGTLFGALIADLLTGRDPATLPVPVEPFRPVRFAGALSRLGAMGLAAHRVWRSL